jgi:hypothetical protein
LKIENVRRKPSGIGASLEPDQAIFSDDKLQQSLVEIGFFPARTRNGKELFSSNGDVLVDLKDGVRYILRFGKVAGVQAGSEGQKLNRFLLVTAQLTDEVQKPPTLEPEPAGPAAPATTPPAAETPKSSGGGCQEEGKKEETKTAEPTKEKAKAEGTKAKSGAETPPKPPVKLDPAQAELERVKKANQRKLDEFNTKKKKAEARVADLNARFGDWYYVISEDTYKKIHLGRADIIREGATAKETGFGVDAFRLLEKEGIKKPATPAPGPGGPGGPGGFPPGGFPGLPPM